MKRQEIQNCVVCGRGIMACGNPMFFQIKVQSFGVDTSAVQQMAGLEQFFGGGSQGAVLADVMGPSPDIAQPLSEEEAVHLICGECSTKESNLASILYREE